MPAPFRCAMIGRRSEADAELDAHRTRLLEARDPAIIGTRGARVSRAGLGEVELRILIEDVERSEEHTSELQSLMRISYAVFCLKKKKHKTKQRSQCTTTR